MIDLPLNYARVLYDMNIDPENLNKARSLLTESAGAYGSAGKSADPQIGKEKCHRKNISRISLEFCQGDERQ